MTSNRPPRLPAWLSRPLPAGATYRQTESTLDHLSLNTICTHAQCPNRGQCWTRGTATVLILGDTCTRNCKFCSVSTGKPLPPNPNEPEQLASLVGQLKLKYLVITSVNRDDLPDGGAGHFRACVERVRCDFPETQFELLTPDFRGCETEALESLRPALPFVFGHNLETVPRLYPVARRGANYQGSLNLLRHTKALLGNVTTKSSLMLGLGETEAEIEAVLHDLREVDCDRLTLGQYLRPSKESLEVVDYIHPDRFAHWQETAQSLGFRWVISEPFARSSYFAEQDNPDPQKLSCASRKNP